MALKTENQHSGLFMFMFDSSFQVPRHSKLTTTSKLPIIFPTHLQTSLESSELCRLVEVKISPDILYILLLETPAFAAYVQEEN